MHPLLALAARRNEVAILWWVRWCGRDEMVNTLLQYSHPPVFPSNFLSLPLSFPSLVRSVDYEDTSSSLTVWPLRHVLMRSASLHCIINKSEKWLFLCLFPHTVLYLPLFCACYLEWLLKKKKKKKKAGYGVLLNFLCAPSRPLFPLHECDHQPPRIPFLTISKGRYYFSPLMISHPCYDIICFNFNLNVTDVMDFIN